MKVSVCCDCVVLLRYWHCSQPVRAVLFCNDEAVVFKHCLYMHYTDSYVSSLEATEVLPYKNTEEW
jgi:hypothetical protein